MNWITLKKKNKKFSIIKSNPIIANILLSLKKWFTDFIIKKSIISNVKTKSVAPFCIERFVTPIKVVTKTEKNEVINPNIPKNNKIAIDFLFVSESFCSKNGTGFLASESLSSIL